MVRDILRGLYHTAIKVSWIFLLPLIRARVSNSDQLPLITCDRNDGGGAQLHGRISAIAFASSVGLQYVHTALSDVHFSAGDDITKWNNLIDFEVFGPQIPDDAELVKFSSMPKLLSYLALNPKLRDGGVIHVEHCHAFTDRFPMTISRLRPILRSGFERAIELGNSPKPNQTEDVVIHFRGLVGPETSASPRLSSTTTLKKKIDIAKSLRKLPVSRIVCVSPTEDLLREIDTSFILDTHSEVHEVVRMIAEAKFAFAAKSSLSYVAALLNQNTVFYEKFWHPKMPDWKQL